MAKKSVPAGERTIGDAAPASPAPATEAATGAVKPSRPTERPKPTKQAPTRKIIAGDLVCGACGEGNPTSRKFCSRCGTTLADAEVAKNPWWQFWKRLVPKRRRKTLAAGDRPWKTASGAKKRSGIGPKLLRVFAKVRPIAAGLLLVAGLVYGVSPNLRDNVNERIGSARDEVMSRLRPTFVPLAPIASEANLENEGNEVQLAIDSNTLTSWIAPTIVDGLPAEPTMVVRFDQPIDLERVKIWNGAAVGFKDHARVKLIHFVFDTGNSYDLDVTDLPDGQDYEVSNGAGVREVEVHIVETHASLSSTDVGLSEIEFLVQK